MIDYPNSGTSGSKPVHLEDLDSREIITTRDDVTPSSPNAMKSKSTKSPTPEVPASRGIQISS
ncbi:hypothetical protein SynWH8103_01551 [Synechococcus sp. WH 8103]|nr:hypothetical protein SynWH8103_01551 [Synechococcus sp. WH 8103]